MLPQYFREPKVHRECGYLLICGKSFVYVRDQRNVKDDRRGGTQCATEESTQHKSERKNYGLHGFLRSVERRSASGRTDSRGKFISDSKILVNDITSRLDLAAEQVSGFPNQAQLQGCSSFAKRFRAVHLWTVNSAGEQRVARIRFCWPLPSTSYGSSSWL